MSTEHFLAQCYEDSDAEDAVAEDLESATLTITPDPAYQTFAASL